MSDKAALKLERGRKRTCQNPTLRARAPRESCTGPIEAHGKQFFISALEEVGSLAIIRCIFHGCLFEDAMERPKQWADFGEGSFVVRVCADCQRRSP